PHQSELIARITAVDPETRMPPATTHKKLTAEQKELLARWIARGAEYEPHWSYIAPVRPPLPAVKDRAWPRNPIDGFVLARLEAEGLEPAPEADRRTLARRVTLDLTGLPPEPADVEAFVNDQAPDAYERYVDRLLTSSGWGEHRGRYWLDVARYADTHGIHFDNFREMWPYRDWVIKAFNRDLPFDEFTTEQLAGDLLPKPTLDQLVATGFHRNTLINSEGGTKADQFRDEQVKDRVDTTGGVWLGLTVGCAKCHTHKYDPVSQKEYYQLYSFFNSTADQNSIAPTIKAPTTRQQQRLKQLDEQHASLLQQLNDDPDRKQRLELWEASLVKQAAKEPADEKDDSTQWTVLDLDSKSTHGATLKPLDDKSVLVSGKNVANDEYKLTARSPLTTIRSVRLEVLTHDSLPKRGPGRAGNGNFVLSEIWFRTGDGRELRFSKAQADHSQPKFDVAGAIDGKPKTGWAINGAPEGGPNHNRTAWLVLPKPLEVEKEHALVFTMQFTTDKPYNIGRLRLSISSTEWVDKPSVSELAKLANVPVDQRTKQQKQRLENAFLQSDQKLGPVYRELQSVAKQREQLTADIPTTMVLRATDSPRIAHVQIRGDFLRPGEPVESTVPAVLPRMQEKKEPRTRLDLARWLTRPDNPLTPRVRVNRIWMRLFGRGLVETENDFGTQGTLPTHPQLLDWLASEFVRNGWSTKQTLRLIVNSATYRQSSRSRAKLHAVDPRNYLLWRQNRVRVEGEIVRDLGLAASGLLSGKIGGPSVYPPQPDGVYAFTQRKKNWKTSTGEDRYRRGMYTFFQRTSPYPMLMTFDSPDSNTCTARRSQSNTPLQALTIWNDVVFFECAQNLARRIVNEAPGTGDARATDRQRAIYAFQLCVARRPDSEEVDVVLELLDEQRKLSQADEKAAAAIIGNKPIPKDTSAVELSAWVAVGRTLINLDEFITRE
ncbi:MAG: DUF1553 domain-containing protein, partial [Planctomycetes bacterium]|nr:DUF1553 domain-containing protein [Planctomycetota bacterium]